MRRQISSRIIAAALATGEVVETASALQDDRFREAESVRINQIRAVLCAPIGGAQPIGVLYLQGRAGGVAFSPADRRRAEAFARHLGPVAVQALARHVERSESDPTRAARARIDGSGVVGRSVALARVLSSVSVAAPVDMTVLLVGPSGSGKSLLAQVIHRSSPRCHGPLVIQSCAGMNAERLDAELFGAEGRPGKIAAARGGTLVIDAIDELPQELQVKLLAVLDTGKGPQGEAVDLRLVVSTQADLDELVRAGRFRAELRYRIQVVTIVVPSLRERREDVVPLALHFCRLTCARHGLPSLSFSPSALSALEIHEWPGNVRQLAQAVEGAAIWASGAGATSIEQGHLFPGSSLADGIEVSYQQAVRAFQQSLLLRVLEECDWNITRAAKRLDLARSHVYNLIRGLGLREE
mgnify:CR=1 FL=1